MADEEDQKLCRATDGDNNTVNKSNCGGTCLTGACVSPSNAYLRRPGEDLKAWKKRISKQMSDAERSIASSKLNSEQKQLRRADEHSFVMLAAIAEGDEKVAQAGYTGYMEALRASIKTRDIFTSLEKSEGYRRMSPEEQQQYQDELSVGMALTLVGALGNSISYKSMNPRPVVINSRQSSSKDKNLSYQITIQLRQRR